MTDEERWKIEGRTRDALREARKNLNSLKIEIEEYVKRLEEAGGTLRHFLANPTGKGPTGMSSREYALHFFEMLIPRDVARQLKEYEAESERISDLESKVKNFGE